MLIVAATLLSYWPVFHAGFIWDDDLMLTRNALVKSADGLFGIWFSATLPDYFPLTSTSLWLEHRLWGLNPLGYHVTNVLLHALSATLLWRVLDRLKIPGAWLAALIFAVHPVNVESVAWITERKNTLAMFFYSLTLLWYLRFDSASANPQAVRAWPWYGASLIAFLLALLSKTAVVMLPLVLLLCRWWRHTGKSNAGGAPAHWRQQLMPVLPFFALSLIFGLVTLWFQHHRAIGGDAIRSADFPTRLAEAGGAVWFYLYKALVPLNLSFVYPRWEWPRSFAAFLPGIALSAGMASAWIYRRSWGRSVFFALAYYALMLLPALGLVDVYFHRYSLVADHWQYFSIIGAIAFAVGVIASKLKAQSVPFLAGPLVVLLGALTWRQAAIYTDAQTLWDDTLKKNPDCWMAHNNLACLLAAQGKVGEAVGHLQTALRLKPDYADALTNLGSLLNDQGRFAEALPYLTNAVARNRDHADARYNLARALARQGRMSEAVAQYELALNLKPNWPEALNVLAWIRATHADATVRNGPEAVRLATRAVDLTGGQDANALDTLAAAYAEAERFTEAEQTARRAAGLLQAAGRAESAGEVLERLQLYQSRQPYHQPP